MSLRRLRTLVRREVRATLRDPFTLGVLIAVPLRRAARLRLRPLDRGRGHDARRARREPLGREPPAGRGARGQRARSGRGATRRARRSSAALVAGEISAALVIPPDFERDLRRARAGGARPRCSVLYDGAEAVLAGNAEAFLAGHRRRHGRAARGERRRRARAPRRPAPASTVVTRALFNPGSTARRSWWPAPSASCCSFLTTLITAVSIVNERLAGTFDQLQLTPATHARDPARQAPAARRRVRVRRGADGARRRLPARRLAAGQRAASSSRSRRSTCSSRSRSG